jgi:RNA ligase
MIQDQINNVYTEYHKIDTIFERGEDFTVDPTRLKHPVIGTINLWDVTEKIDGTNMQVKLTEQGEVCIGGRTDNAQLPGDLIQSMARQFGADKLKAIFQQQDPLPVILYGEGYGGKISKNKGYRQDKAFILFDVLVFADGKRWWLDRENVNDVAERLGCDVVPYLGRMTLDQIVDTVRAPFASKIGSAIAEGVVGRPLETLYDKRGERLIIKLKTRDFTGGR